RQSGGGRGPRRLRAEIARRDREAAHPRDPGAHRLEQEPGVRDPEHRALHPRPQDQAIRPEALTALDTTPADRYTPATQTVNSFDFRSFRGIGDVQASWIRRGNPVVLLRVLGRLHEPGPVCVSHE